MPQSLLNLTISARTVLVNTETLRAALGVDAETISAQVDEGKFRWVFDVAARGNGDLRELRFWAREIIAPEQCAGLTEAAAVDSIIGTQVEHLRGPAVAQLLLVSRPTIFRLWQAGEIKGPICSGVFRITRSSLQQFLRRRLIGAEVERKS